MTRNHEDFGPKQQRTTTETRHETEGLPRYAGHDRRHDGRHSFLRHQRNRSRHHPQTRLRMRDK